MELKEKIARVNSSTPAEEFARFDVLIDQQRQRFRKYFSLGAGAFCIYFVIAHNDFDSIHDLVLAAIAIGIGRLIYQWMQKQDASLSSALAGPWLEKLDRCESDAVRLELSNKRTDRANFYRNAILK